VLTVNKFVFCLVLVLSWPAVEGQSALPDQTERNIAPPLQSQPEAKRIAGVIPNYESSSSLKTYEPLTSREKFKIASEDTFDRGTFILAGIFATQGLVTNSNRAFGSGAAGFGRYFGAAYGDQFVGNYMTEAIFPTLLYQDPRYFRKGQGSGWSRLGYAVDQIFWTHRDNGGMQFNYSEFVGNSAAVAISNAYYVDNRTAGDAATKLGVQIGIDMMTNILKEFWPDLQRRFHHDKETRAATGPGTATP
jgi:hypothetical protein